MSDYSEFEQDEPSDYSEFEEDSPSSGLTASEADKRSLLGDSPRTLLDSWKAHKEKTKPSMGKTALLGLAQGATFNHLDELYGAGRALTGKESYTDARDRARFQIDEASKENPTTAIGSELVGSMLTAPALGSGRAALAAGGAIAGLGASTKKGFSAVPDGVAGGVTADYLGRAIGGGKFMGREMKSIPGAILGASTKIAKLPQDGLDWLGTSKIGKWLAGDAERETGKSARVDALKQTVADAEKDFGSTSPIPFDESTIGKDDALALKLAKDARAGKASLGDEKVSADPEFEFGGRMVKLSELAKKTPIRAPAPVDLASRTKPLPKRDPILGGVDVMTKDMAYGEKREGATIYEPSVLQTKEADRLRAEAKEAYPDMRASQVDAFIVEALHPSGPATRYRTRYGATDGGAGTPGSKTQEPDGYVSFESLKNAVPKSNRQWRPDSVGDDMSDLRSRAAVDALPAPKPKGKASGEDAFDIMRDRVANAKNNIDKDPAGYRKTLEDFDRMKRDYTGEVRASMGQTFDNAKKIRNDMIAHDVDASLEALANQSREKEAKALAAKAGEKLGAIGTGRAAATKALQASAAITGFSKGGYTGGALGAAAGGSLAKGAIKAVDLTGDAARKVEAVAQRLAQQDNAIGRSARWALQNISARGAILATLPEVQDELMGDRGDMPGL